MALPYISAALNPAIKGLAYAAAVPKAALFVADKTFPKRPFSSANCALLG